MTWTASFLLRFFVFSLLCCKYMCDTYLSNLDFNGLCSAANGLFNNIFNCKITEDIQSQRRNDHMEVYVNMMEGKWSFFV